MFSSALRVGIRLNAWKMKPILSRRICVSARSLRFEISTSPTKVVPLVSRSSPAMHCMSVDLPDPDGPMIAVNFPVSNPTVTSRRAWTSVSPAP